MNTKNAIFILSLSLFFCISCKTFDQPKEVKEKLDYSKEEVVSNEVVEIKRLLESNPIKALWKASFIKDNSIYQKVIDNMELQIDRAVEQKNYLLADKLYTSLESLDYVDKSGYSQKIKELKNQTLLYPKVEQSKLPKTSKQCVDATVTVWVDKGYKVVNGAGVSDIILGSGFFIDKKGYLVTNYHVIQDMVDPSYEGYCRLYIKLLDDQDNKIPAKVIGYDQAIDIALLKVEMTPEYVFELGSSSDLQIGDSICAIGTPLGLEGTITSGIISSTDRKLNTILNVFQLDAAVNSGNSGGPLIDKKNKVQGIVFAGIQQYQGLNFAIPVEYLKIELPQLLNGEEIFHSWIGAYGNTVKEKSQKKGVRIDYVMPGASAYYAGLEKGDVILKINNIDALSLEDFQMALMNCLSESIVKITYKNKDEQVVTKPIYLEKRPKNPAVSFYKSDLLTDSFLPLFGIKMVHSSTTNRKSYTIKEVIPNSYADQMGFSENDPITINDIKIDEQQKYIITYVFVKRKKQGFLDINMVLAAPFDSSHYF